MIKGIDSQMMITRAPEMVRDSDAQLRKGELMQDYLAVQAKAMDERDRHQVKEAIESQEVELKNDKEGGAGGQGDGASQRQGRPGEANDPLDQLVPSEEHVIDIKI